MSDFKYFKVLWERSRGRGGILRFIWLVFEPVAWFIPPLEVPVFIWFWGAIPAIWRAARYIAGFGEVTRWWFPIVGTFNLPVITWGSWNPWAWVASFAFCLLMMYLSWRRFRDSRFRTTAKAWWWWFYVIAISMLYSRW